MKLTDEQKALYRAVADGKRIEARRMVGYEARCLEWTLWKPETLMLGDPEYEWRVAPETITITIPRPGTVFPVGRYTLSMYYNTVAERDACLDAINKDQP